MPPYGEPDWASPGDTTNNATSVTGVTAAPQASGQNANTADDRNKARCVVLGLSFLNIGLSCMMGALGVLALIGYSPSKFEEWSAAFLAVYMIMFAALLFCYELIWWQPIAALNKMFRKNFGFLYGLKGKGFYLIFIAFLTLGFREQNLPSAVNGLDIATGVGWLVGGLLHLFVACTMPEVGNIYKPPTAGLAEMGSIPEEPNNPV